MLSKTDIIKELGKGICIFPLDLDSIKENSINLSAGEFAWATSSCDIFFCEDEYDKNKRFSLIKDDIHNQTITITAKSSAIVSDARNNKYIILLPLSTTLIETKEVLAVNNYIGGTYHSKVGLASKGLGHIGTMVGPNFSGDSLIALHNNSKDLIVLQVGDSIVSVVFHYLDTPYQHLNPTSSGHTDKFSEWGLQVSETQANILNQDWKKNFHEVRKKMCDSEAYEKLQEEMAKQKKRIFRRYLNIKNISICLSIAIILVGLYFVALLIDKWTNTDEWVTRYFDVGFSGIILAIILGLIKHIKPSSEN